MLAILAHPSGCNELMSHVIPVVVLNDTPYSCSGLMHRLGGGFANSSPDQTVNKSVRRAWDLSILGPAPVRITTPARSTSCSHSHRPELEPRCAYAYSGTDYRCLSIRSAIRIT